jgi:hypothetical protein
MKSSLHRLISFLPLFCNCELNSLPLLPSSYPGRLASRNSSQFYAANASYGIVSCNTLHGLGRKHSLSIVGKACLQRRCIVTEVTRLFLAYSFSLECVNGVVS